MKKDGEGFCRACGAGNGFPRRCEHWFGMTALTGRGDAWRRGAGREKCGKFLTDTLCGMGV